MTWTESRDGDENTCYESGHWKVSQVLKRDRIWWAITSSQGYTDPDGPHEFMSASGAKMVCERRERLAASTNIREAYPAMDQVSAKEGWDDPEMDVYNRPA